MSPLIKIFTVYLVNLFFIPIFEIRNKQGHCPNLAICLNIPDFTLLSARFECCVKVISIKNVQSFRALFPRQSLVIRSFIHKV